MYIYTQPNYCPLMYVYNIDVKCFLRFLFAALFYVLNVLLYFCKVVIFKNVGKIAYIGYVIKQQIKKTFSSVVQ